MGAAADSRGAGAEPSRERMAGAAAPPDIGHDTPVRRANAVALLDADLHGLLQIKEVNEVIQAKLAIARVRTISRLSTVADDRAGMRRFCVDSLGLDEARDVIDIASMVDAWESSSTRMSVRHKAEAEAGLASQPRALNKVEIQDLLTKFQSVHGLKLEDKNIPAASTLEQIFDQVEQGELKNMSLVQFVSREDAEADVLGATIEKGTGALKVKKGYGECPKPRSPEEFRRRMAVVSHAYLLAQLKFPQKAILRDLQPVHFLKYLDLMLGEHVLGLKAKNQAGETVASPEFDLMLSYDFQVRRNMVKLANEGRLLHEALKESMADTTIKERYFLTPNVYSQVALGHGRSDSWRSRSPPVDRSWNAERGRDWDKGKGKSRKGGGKSKGKKGGKQLHDRTPDGRQICWRWNNPRERCRFNCGRLHVCQACFGSHPVHACDNSGKPKDTAGAPEGGGKAA